jgi:LAO/AO transport system kinase
MKKLRAAPLRITGEFEAKRREQDVRWMHAMIEDHIRTTFLSSGIAAAKIAALGREVRSGIKPPSVAADEAAALILERP